MTYSLIICPDNYKAISSWSCGKYIKIGNFTVLADIKDGHYDLLGNVLVIFTICCFLFAITIYIDERIRNYNSNMRPSTRPSIV